MTAGVTVTVTAAAVGPDRAATRIKNQSNQYSKSSAHPPGDSGRAAAGQPGPAQDSKVGAPRTPRPASGGVRSEGASASPALAGLMTLLSTSVKCISMLRDLPEKYQTLKVSVT